MSREAHTADYPRARDYPWMADGQEVFSTGPGIGPTACVAFVNPHGEWTSMAGEAYARLIAAAPAGLAAANAAIASAVVDEGPADQVNISGESYRALVAFAQSATGEG